MFQGAAREVKAKFSQRERGEHAAFPCRCVCMLTSCFHLRCYQIYRVSSSLGIRTDRTFKMPCWMFGGTRREFI